jgi:hypothetical protein
MTTVNPLQKPLEKKDGSDFLPIHLCCVLDELSDYNDPHIHAIRDYAISMKIIFKSREYDSRKYSDDCNEIRRLPAYHIYIKGNRYRTFYPNTRPYQHIQETLDEYNAVLERKKLRKTRLTRFYAAFMSLFKRKTAMEKAGEVRKGKVSEWA